MKRTHPARRAALAIAMTAGLGLVTVVRAQQEAAPPNLLYVLNPDKPDALKISGSTLAAANARVYVLSNHKRAINIGSEGKVTVRGMLAVGGTEMASTAKTTIKERLGSIEVRDPMAGIATPVFTGLTNLGTARVSGDQLESQLLPGLYDKVEAGLKAQVKLNSGVYAIKELTLHTGAVVTGANVMLYVGKLRMDSKAKLTISAPAHGDYKDLAVFVSRRTTDPAQINTEAQLEVTGTVYVANAPLILSSNAKLTCSHLVVNTLDVANGATLTLR